MAIVDGLRLLQLRVDSADAQVCLVVTMIVEHVGVVEVQYKKECEFLDTRQDEIEIENALSKKSLYMVLMQN